ncbi:MAG: hypothetical protein DWH82_00240 [Planctomycetota bacterium]|nr:MAG: hypothetical protein DWH82_00240 [Planctomycetota bacterium]
MGQQGVGRLQAGQEAPPQLGGTVWVVRVALLLPGVPCRVGRVRHQLGEVGLRDLRQPGVADQRG